MMVAFVWGKNILTNQDLPAGFEVAEVMKTYGFKDGDKILQVNGEDIENVVDISKYLFLRDINQVRVERYNGKQENISIPEDIGTVMFENGAINAFIPMVPAVLDSIVPNSPAYNAGLTSGDKILKVKWK